MSGFRRLATDGRRDVEVTIPAEGAVLAGTLTLPTPPTLPTRDGGTAPPAPAVLLVAGSGPVDRDSDHRRLPLGITRLLAEALADAGVASLRYDKRGVGASTGGDWRRTGMDEATDDARHALAVLAGRPEVDPERLAVAGHSEGALHVARLAASSHEGSRPAVQAAVLLSCSARPGGEVLAYQARVLAPTLPAPVRLLLRLLRTDLAAKQRRTAERIAATTTDVAWVGGARINARWYREFLTRDPREDLARIAVPVLALTGSKDLQVDPADALEIARLAPHATGEVLEDVDHILRHVPGTPSVSAYKREVREPLDPRVTGRVVAWTAQALGARVG